MEFMKKFGSEELSDEVLELISGGKPADSYAILLEICKSIPATQVREECDVTLRDFPNF